MVTLTRSAERAQQRAEAKKDARARAFRSFIQGLITDALFGVLVVLLAALNAPEFTWSAMYWQLVAMGLIKTILISITSYLMRFMSPPADTP